MAADARALWLLVADADGSVARLERRDPRTARLLGTTRLPRRAISGLAVTPRRAWVLTRNRQLLAVDRAGRVRRALGRVTAVVAQGDQLWALRSGGRALVNLHPRTGRVRSSAPVRRPLVPRLTFTRSYVWGLEASGRAAVRLPRA
jgi:sugar lactone lactonase YvrE